MDPSLDYLPWKNCKYYRHIPGFEPGGGYLIASQPARVPGSGLCLGLCRTPFPLQSEQQPSVSPRVKGGLVRLEVLNSLTGLEPVEHAGHWERASTWIFAGRL